MSIKDAEKICRKCQTTQQYRHFRGLASHTFIKRRYSYINLKTYKETQKGECQCQKL